MSGLGAAIAGGNPGALGDDGRDRDPRDFYRTPPEATVALLRFIWPDNDAGFWDPACGDGAICIAIEREGYRAVGTDVLPDGEYPTADFFDCRVALATNVVTNPPFRLAEKFICHAVNLRGVRTVAMLTKAQFWHAAKRAPLFEEHPPSWICPLTWRLNFLEGQKKPDGTP